MEMKELVNDRGIIGIISSYKSNFDYHGKVKDLKVKDISKALQIVGLDDSYLDKDIDSLGNSDLFKMELITKLDSDFIIVGDNHFHNQI